MSYLKEFISKIQKIDYPGFLTLWEEYCNGDQLDADELIAILDNLRKSEMGPNLGRHIERILPLWETCQDPEKSFKVLRGLLDVQYAFSDVMADAAMKMIEARFGQASQFQEKLKLVGLKTKDKIQGCIRNFELLDHLSKGNFVLHGSGWGVGEVLDISFLREEFSVEFELVAGKKTLSFSTAYKTLEPISKEHILAMRFSKPDELELFAKKDPVVFMKKFLVELGPKTASEIKDELCDLVIPQDEWVKWWQQTRAKLKKDAMIECPEELKQCFKLRLEELTYEERLKKILSALQGELLETIDAVYSFFRDFPDAYKSPVVVSLAKKALEHFLDQGHLRTSEELMIYMLLDDLGEADKQQKLEELIKSYQDLVPIFEQIPIISLKKRALVLIRALRPDWKMLFELLLMHINYHPLRDYLFGELSHEGSHEGLHQFVQKLMAHPYEAPDAFIWLFEKGAEDHDFCRQYQLTLPLLFQGLLILLSRVEVLSTQKNSAKKILSFMMDDKFALVRQVMKEASIADLKEILLLCSKCQSFSDHELKIFQSLAEVAEPSLAKVVQEGLMGDDPHVIWCTQEGYIKMQKRVHHIATVETVDNAKEIETARGHGDLRENAEFKAALERRDRLQGELKLLSDQLSLARVISKDDIVSGKVGVGCVVKCKNTHNQEISYKILGPWEADSDRHILSYQSKLAQTLAGKVKGDKFQVQGEEFTITHIGSYLD
jgi:transcription elongation factor GreA-like protein/transcription elongation GreA/GreB family factor